MKKILSLMLAALLLVSAVPVAYATNDYTAGTVVSYAGTGTEAYTVTVPAALDPGESGTVTATGTFPSNKTLSVTAETSVELACGTDTKTLNVSFPGITLAGSNTNEVTASETVGVEGWADADQNNIAAPLFGTWSGHFEYNVELAEANQETGIVYNAWYRLTSSTEAILFADEQTMFINQQYAALSPAYGIKGMYEVKGSQILDTSSGEVFATISDDGKTIESPEAGTFVLDESTLNTQLTYFRYIQEDTYVAYQPGITWAEFIGEDADAYSSLWLINSDGVVYDNDHTNTTDIVMDANRKPVKGTDLIVEDALYLCDKE